MKKDSVRNIILWNSLNEHTSRLNEDFDLGVLNQAIAEIEMALVEAIKIRNELQPLGTPEQLGF